MNSFVISNSLILKLIKSFSVSSREMKPTIVCFINPRPKFMILNMNFTWDIIIHYFIIMSTWFSYTVIIIFWLGFRILILQQSKEACFVPFTKAPIFGRFSGRSLRGLWLLLAWQFFHLAYVTSLFPTWKKSLSPLWRTSNV